MKELRDGRQKKDFKKSRWFMENEKMEMKTEEKEVTLSENPEMAGSAIKVRRGISRRVILGYVLFGIAVTMAAVFVGARIYRDNTYERYHEWSYKIAQIVEESFSEEMITNYANLAMQYKTGEISYEEIAAYNDSPEYVEARNKLETLRSGIGANDISIIYMDPKDFENYSSEVAKTQEIMPLVYILDTYYDDSLSFHMGDSWWILDEYAPIIESALAQGSNPTEKIISNGSFGYTISAFHPIYRDGRTIACVAVEIPMSTLNSEITHYIQSVSLVAAIVAVVLMALALVMIVRSMVNPIVLVANEATNFLTSENQISEKLGMVKTRDEIQSLSESILQMEIGINNYIENLTKVTAEKERIGAELNVATKIQADMLPTDFPENDRFELFASMEPAKEVGGDFYDFFLIDENHLCMVMADVSGKGVPAALFMVIAKTLLKNVAMQGLEPNEILSKVNNLLCENNGGELFVTVWLGIMDLETGHVIAANAGHEDLAVRGKDGNYELLKTKHGFVLAGMEGMKYKNYEFDLEKGGSFYIYTDGVTEATSEDLELFGLDRMVDALNRNPEAAPKELLPGVREAIDEFVGEADQFDDITMLAVKLK